LMPLTAGNDAWRQRADVSELLRLREHPRQRFAWHDALRNSLFLRNFPFLLLKYFSVRHLFLKRSSFIGPWPGPVWQNFVISFLFQNSALFTNKSTKREPALTETENSNIKIQNTNPDHMQQQSGMFSSVFNLNVLFNLSDDMSTFRARPVCELYNISKPTILQVRCRDPISILRNLCPWHSALFAVVVLFVCSYRTFLLVCMPSLWLYVVCGVFWPKSRQLFIQIPCLIFLVLFFAFRAK